MSVKALSIALFIVFVLIIIGLFIEKRVLKKRSTLVFSPPNISVKIPGEKLGIEGDVYIYNSDETTRAKVLEGKTDEEITEYIDKPILEHSSTRISKPFSNAVSSKSMLFTEPVSFIYETATEIASITSSMFSSRNSPAQYHMLIPSKANVNAFTDEGNIYIRKI